MSWSYWVENKKPFTRLWRQWNYPADRYLVPYHQWESSVKVSEPIRFLVPEKSHTLHVSISNPSDMTFSDVVFSSWVLFIENLEPQSRKARLCFARLWLVIIKITDFYEKLRVTTWQVQIDGVSVNLQKLNSNSVYTWLKYTRKCNSICQEYQCYKSHNEQCTTTFCISAAHLLSIVIWRLLGAIQYIRRAGKILPAGS